MIDTAQGVNGSGFDGVISTTKYFMENLLTLGFCTVSLFLERENDYQYVEVCVSDESDQQSISDVVAIFCPTVLDFTGWMCQCTHPHPGGRWAVPFGHRVHRRGAGYKASLRRPVGLEDLGQG